MVEYSRRRPHPPLGAAALSLTRKWFLVIWFYLIKDFLIMNFLLNVGIAPDSAVTFYVKK